MVFCKSLLCFSQAEICPATQHFINQETGTYGWPLLRQPHGAVKGVAGLQDGRLWWVQALPLIRGSDDSLHVLLHTRYRATLDAAATGGGAGCPRAAFPTEVKKKKALSYRVDRAAVAKYLISDIPRQRVVQVIWHDLLVAITRGQRIEKIQGETRWAKTGWGLAAQPITWPGRAPCCTPEVWVWASHSQGNSGSTGPPPHGCCGDHSTRPRWAGSLHNIEVF